jgi:two-component system sensor kinase FixL
MQRPVATVASTAQDHGKGIPHAGETVSIVSKQFCRAMDGLITSWPASMQRRYGFTAEQAVGQISHHLLKTIFPVPLTNIQAVLLKEKCWRGGLIHRHVNGYAIMVMTHWNLDFQGSLDCDTVTEFHSDATSMEIADLFAIMANELSQPLTAIAIYLNGARRSLQRDAPDVEVACNAMALAAGQVERSTALVMLMRSLAEDSRRPS